ncbi:minor capsid protein [Bacillus sp. 3255]|uniref:minor capsid protein n=1 Tax=Bacillus sp. 3255 TaxID=2817904 RepID=UPI00285FF3B5|nr:minor capsid protein [Bacillus sp. 3255]MDR6883783.1 SPP1 gp7 family putative phage head morphogenesis protein [Bacillus sp. 3255]
MEQLNEAQLAKGEAYIQNMKREYGKAMASIQKDINAFYQRFAKNNEIDLATARQILKAGELKEFKWSVEDYIKAGRENAIDQRWMKELENASIQTRMSRLESLQIQMRQQIELLSAHRQAGTSTLLNGIYKDNYYRSIFELQKGVGYGSSFSKLDTRQINNLLVTPWAPDGSNFSQRIWGDRVRLIHELQTTLTQGLIRGDSSEKMITRLSERMGVSRARAETLILTESAYFSGASRRTSYVELSIEKYRNVATLDKRTSDICRTMDGSIFLVSEARAGLNCAPFHARCRTVDIPYFEDNVKQRAARGEDGKTYDVPGDMNYEQWAKQHAPNDATKPLEVAEVQPAEEVIKNIGRVEEPAGDFNRRFNPRASYYADLPDVSDEVGEKLANINREIAREGGKTGNEQLVILDRTTGDELVRVAGTNNNVKMSEDMDKLLRAADDRSVILTHNHPKGTRVNVKDAVNLALYQSISDIVAVGHDGGVSFISAQEKSIDFTAMLALIKKIFIRVETQLQTDKEYAMMSKTAQPLYFDYLVLQELVLEMGWIYGEDFKATKDYPRI